MAKIYKTVTKRTTARMVKEGALTRGEYVLTKNYLAVPAKDAKKAGKYLDAHGYGSTGEVMCHCGESQLEVFYINEM